MSRYDWWVYLLLALPGILLFFYNWFVYFYNKKGEKFVSGIVLVGGVWIMIVALISPIHSLALIGFADPGVWMLLGTLALEFYTPPRKVLKIVLSVVVGIILLPIIIFHRFLFGGVHMVTSALTVESKVSDSKCREVTLSQEQMLEDLDYLFDVTVNTSLSTPYAEECYGVDYDELYEEAREKVLACEDEYEFTALMIALTNKLPGGHTCMMAPDNPMSFSFPMGEFADKDTRVTNASLCSQFEDRMGEYNENVIVAIYYDGDYIMSEPAAGNHDPIEGLDGARLVSLNGKPVKDVVQDLDTLYHWRYDSEEDAIFVTNIIFNDGVGEKYEAELERWDGTTFKQDLYVSAEFNMAFYYRTRLYPEHYKKDEETTSDEKGKSYTITVDEERKVLYGAFSRCDDYEIQEVKEALEESLASAEIDSVILDFRGNPGGNYGYVTEGVLPAVLDHDAGFVCDSTYPRTEYNRDFWDSGYYRTVMRIKGRGDTFHIKTNLTVKGEAEKPYRIYALVNHSTFSSGDIFAYLAKEDGITLIGQNTGGDGITGNPLQTYLPNSALQFTFSSSVSDVYPEDACLGVEPDLYTNHDWESYKRQRETCSDIGQAESKTYENRQKWDEALNTAIRLSEEAE